MKTVVALSDTHGNRAVYDKISQVLDKCDFIFHLGDTSADGNALKSRYPKKTYVLNGNCDTYPSGEKEVCVKIDGVRVFACHGDRYGVRRGLDELAYRAEELECTLALYGHTHDAREDEINGITVINPGEMTKYGRNSYAYIVINSGKIVSKIVYI